MRGLRLQAVRTAYRAGKGNKVILNCFVVIHLAELYGI
jgi:hypothetical protein